VAGLRNDQEQRANDRIRRQEEHWHNLRNDEIQRQYQSSIHHAMDFYAAQVGIHYQSKGTRDAAVITGAAFVSAVTNKPIQEAARELREASGGDEGIAPMPPPPRLPPAPQLVAFRPRKLQGPQPLDAARAAAGPIAAAAQRAAPAPAASPKAPPHAHDGAPHPPSPLAGELPDSDST
jgi:hypothetical protein